MDEAKLLGEGSLELLGFGLPWVPDSDRHAMGGGHMDTVRAVDWRAELKKARVYMFSFD